VLTALYSVCNLFHLGAWNSRYWDEWILYRDIPRLREIETSCAIGRCKLPFTFLWEQPLLQLGPWALRLMVIIALFLASVLVWKIICGIPQLGQWERSVTTIFFLLLPINGARIGLSSARASFALALFSLGVWLVCQRRFTQTLFGLALISYTMFWPSFQVFALVTVVPLALKDLALQQKISKFTIIVGSLIPCLALANTYILANLVVHFGFFAQDDGYNVIRPAFMARAVLIGGLLSAPLAWRLFQSLAIKKSIRHFSGGPLEFGLFILALGTFPYLAVGHFANLSDWIIMWLPDNSDWDSRHQLLQGMGFALLVTSLLKTIQPHMIDRFLLVMISACLVFNLSIYANYYVDGLKQRDVMASFRSQSVQLTGIQLFRIDDSAQDVNARGRGLRAYEWEGMISEALDRPITIWEDNPQTLGCTTEILGKSVQIRKTSGRLKTLVTRGKIVTLDFTDLVTCPYVEP
jgi:hypothetical protein